MFMFNAYLFLVLKILFNTTTTTTTTNNNNNNNNNKLSGSQKY